MCVATQLTVSVSFPATTAAAKTQCALSRFPIIPFFFFFFSSFFTFFEASNGAQARRVSDRGVLPASLQEAMLRGLSIYLKLACLLRVAGSTSLALSLTTLKTKKEM